MRIVGRAAVALGLGISFFALPAQASTSHFSFQVPAQVSIYARGTAAWAPITYTCPSRWATGYAFSNVMVTQQLSGHRVAHGQGTTANFICDDLPHVYMTSITTEDHPFQSGAAARVAFAAQACNADETVCVDPHRASATSLRVGNSPPTTFWIDRLALLRSTGHVAVRLHYRCPAGGGVLVGVGITERLPGGESTHSLDGFESQVPHPQCDENWHSTRIDVAPGNSSPPDPDATPFVAGTAWAHVLGASYSSSPPFPQTDFEGYRVIQIIDA